MENFIGIPIRYSSIMCWVITQVQDCFFNGSLLFLYVCYTCLWMVHTLIILNLLLMMTILMILYYSYYRHIHSIQGFCVPLIKEILIKEELWDESKSWFSSRKYILFLITLPNIKLFFLHLETNTSVIIWRWVCFEMHFIESGCRLTFR